MNAMRLHELPLLGSNQDSPDPESYETGGSAGEIAANAGRTAPEAGNLPHENPHGFQHSPSPVRLLGDATGTHQTAPVCVGCGGRVRVGCSRCEAFGYVPQCPNCHGSGMQDCSVCCGNGGSDAGERGA